ncbi:MAG: hypothetical protein R3A44_25875 [Caldilineaceae bacterium]
MPNREINTGGGAVIEGDGKAGRDIIGRDYIRITHHNYLTKSIIKRVNRYPSILFWLFLLSLIGLQIFLWLTVSAVGIGEEYTRPLDLLFYKVSANNLRLPETQIQEGTQANPTATPENDAQTQVFIETPTEIPVPPQNICIAVGNVSLLNTNLWPESGGQDIGVNVPSGIKVKAISKDNDNVNPWVLVEYENKQGWYSTYKRTEYGEYFDCENLEALEVIILPTPAPIIVESTPEPIVQQVTPTQVTEHPAPTLFSEQAIDAPATTVTNQPTETLSPTLTPTPTPFYVLEGSGTYMGRVDAAISGDTIFVKRPLVFSNDFANWHKLVVDGDLDRARMNISLTYFDSFEKIISQWDGDRCLPSNLVVDNGLESLEINCEYLKRVQ